MAKKESARKPGIVHQDWPEIFKVTSDEIKGHHRSNQFDTLLDHWTGKWPTVDVVGTTTLLLANKEGRVILFSNHRGVCPRFRLLDYVARVSLECHVRKHVSGSYISNIFLVELVEGGVTESTLIFDFDRDADTINTFNAQRMSELNQQLEK